MGKDLELTGCHWLPLTATYGQLEFSVKQAESLTSSLSPVNPFLLSMSVDHIVEAAHSHLVQICQGEPLHWERAEIDLHGSERLRKAPPCCVWCWVLGEGGVHSYCNNKKQPTTTWRRFRFQTPKNEGWMVEKTMKNHEKPTNRPSKEQQLRPARVAKRRKRRGACGWAFAHGRGQRRALRDPRCKAFEAEIPSKNQAKKQRKWVKTKQKTIKHDLFSDENGPADWQLVYFQG